MRLLLLCLPLAVPQEPSSWESVGEIDCLAEGARCFGCHTLNYCNGHGKCEQKGGPGSPFANFGQS